MVWWRQPNFKMEEKGHPGASGMAVSLRKFTAATRWAERSTCSDGERGVGLVMRGLKSQIWDSEWRERSEKMIV